MALVQYGGGILDARGSIGGQVHSRNRYGNYIRARTTPVNPQSQRQNVIRGIIQTLASMWSNTLVAAERAAWEVYADSIVRTNKLGAQVKLTGFNHFIRSNAFILQNGGAVVASGPTTLTLPGADPTFACVVDEAAQLVTVTFDNALAWAIAVGGYLGVYMSEPKAPGVSFIGGPWRLAGTIAGAVVPPTTGEELPCPYVVAEGQVVVCRARIVEVDGRLSDYFQHASAVTA